MEKLHIKKKNSLHYCNFKGGAHFKMSFVPEVEKIKMKNFTCKESIQKNLHYTIPYQFWNGRSFLA